MQITRALQGEPVAWPDDIVSDTTRSECDADLAIEVARLHGAGLSLIALGGGTDGKKPRGAVDGPRWTLQQVLGRMRGASMYGVRLGGMIVVDVDCDTEEARQYVAGRFGNSTVQVRTARGVHHYFRAGNCPVPQGVELPGVTIDFKTGANSYAVGPYSIRPDIGVIYEAFLGRLGEELPEFQDNQPLPVELRGRSVKVGQRNDALFRRGLKFAAVAETVDELLGELIAQRDFDLDDPTTFPDSEVERIAASCWSYKSKGSLWSGRNSTYEVNNRMLIDQLVTKGHNDAFALYHLLAANHGHLGRPFCISPDAMMKAGLWGKGRDTLYHARDVLLDAGLIQKSKGYSFILTPIGMVP